MLSALLFGTLGGQRLTQVDAAPRGVPTSCFGGTITQWTFDNTTLPSVGTGVFTQGAGVTVAASPYISSGMLTPPAFTSSGWPTTATIGATDYLEFSISTLGRTGLGLTFYTNRSDSGPKEYQLQYSIDGAPFVVYDTRTVTTGELLYIYDFSSDVSFNDKTSVVLRLYGYSADSSSGTWRIDNVDFTGTCITLGSTPTNTHTATASPIRSVIITEVAWMGTLASSSHEWIELYNPPGGVGLVDLSNWKIVASDGSPSITIPPGYSIADGQYFLLSNGAVFSNDVITASYQFSSATLLADTGETLFLRDSSNSFIDSANGDGGVWPAGTLTTALLHGTMERMENSGVVTEGDGSWITSANAAFWTKHDIAGNIIHGTPGLDNWGYGITNTPTPTRTITLTPTNTSTVTPSPTRTVTPTQISEREVVMSEVAWMGTLANAEDEWIELLNLTNHDVDLTGWQIRSFRSGSADQVYAIIPLSGVIPKGQYFLMERGDDDVVSDITADFIYQKTYTHGGTSHSSQLSNSGEMLILCTPYNISVNNCKPSTENLITSVADVANQQTFINRTPSASNPWPAGNSSTFGSMERKEVYNNEDTGWFTHTGAEPRWGKDANGNLIKGTPKHENWAFNVTATPRPTNTPTRTPTPLAQPAPVLVLNEFVARPGHDWNNDGQVNNLDEFVEIVNAGQVPVNLSQYKLDDYEQDAAGNEIKNGFSLPSRTLQPGEIAVFYASDTGFFLSDAGDTVRLVKASNYTIADAFTYPAVKSLDISYCRYTDGYGSWLNRCFPTPGLPNSLTSGILPPDPSGPSAEICLLPDNAPLEFVLAECEQGGLDVWNSEYWDSFPGEGEELWLIEIWSKWLEIFK